MDSGEGVDEADSGPFYFTQEQFKGLSAEQKVTRWSQLPVTLRSFFPDQLTLGYFILIKYMNLIQLKQNGVVDIFTV